MEACVIGYPDQKVVHSSVGGIATSSRKLIESILRPSVVTCSCQSRSVSTPPSLPAVLPLYNVAKKRCMGRVERVHVTVRDTLRHSFSSGA